MSLTEQTYKIASNMPTRLLLIALLSEAVTKKF